MTTTDHTQIAARDARSVVASFADAPLRTANERRSAEAAPVTTARAVRALQILGDTAPPVEAAAARLRIQHPQGSLAELGALARPAVTKDTIAGRLRRLLYRADQAARQSGIPDTRYAAGGMNTSVAEEHAERDY